MIHTKNRLIDWKKCIPSIACGIISAVVGTKTAEYIGSETLTKIFASFVFIIGIKELFIKDKSKDNNQES
jgi:uncharacterized membrane protein YfcA